MNNDCSLGGTEKCDGCDQPCLAPELLPIGDGSIKVCASCYMGATAMVFTKLKCSLIATRQPDTFSLRVVLNVLSALQPGK